MKTIELDTGIHWMGLNVILRGRERSKESIKIKGQRFCKLLCDSIKEKATTVSPNPLWNNKDINHSDYFTYKTIEE